ncbi:MAG: hypothetical protein KY468_20740, partial [Armatimonadetes bacterium]|nr:hypothetical protein [Armatimonadota bacterium]
FSPGFVLAAEPAPKLLDPGTPPAREALGRPGPGALVPPPPVGANAPDEEAERTYRNTLQWLRRGQNYARVIDLMESLVSRYPRTAKYWEASGIARVGLALETASVALPDTGGVARSNARYRIAPKDLFEGGVEQIEKAILLQPNVPDFHHSLGWAHLANTRMGLNEASAKSRERAKEAFEAALRLMPRETTYWQSLGDFYRLNPELKRFNPPVDTLTNALTTSNADSSPGATDMLTESKGMPAAAPVPEKSSTPPNPAGDAALPPAIRIFRSISASRPRDAGIHFLLYGQYLTHGDAKKALSELQLAERNDPSNALYPFLRASHSLEPERGGEEAAVGGEQAALDAVRRAQSSPSFDPAPYRPAYPPLLAPALQRALGDSLTPETLNLYDRLSTLAQRLVALGRRWEENGYPAEAEDLYFHVMEMGERMVNSAMSVRNRYLLRLPELSTGLKAQEAALSALRALYARYVMAERTPWLQQQQQNLDRIRQILSQATDTQTADTQTSMP